MSYLEIAELKKQYGKTEVLKNINLDIAAGELVTLLGPSGCGKSTLLRAIAGLTSIGHGEIKLAGSDITHLAAHQRKIGMVFQNYALFPNMNVAKNVAFGLKMQRCPVDEIHQRVNETLKMVELESFSERYPNQLSGGQCQRVALARSLVTRPRLLLLDEPLSALDARMRTQLRTQIRQLQQQLNITTIFVTHDQEEALILSDRIVLMNAGEIVQTGDAATIYSQPACEFAVKFIGHYNLLQPNQALALTGQNYQNRVALRPESVSIGNIENGVPAKIIESTLLGNVIRYRIEVHDFEINVDALNQHNRCRYPNNSNVGLIIDRQSLHEIA